MYTKVRIILQLKEFNIHPPIASNRSNLGHCKENPESITLVTWHISIFRLMDSALWDHLVSKRQSKNWSKGDISTSITATTQTVSLELRSFMVNNRTTVVQCQGRSILEAVKVAVDMDTMEITTVVASRPATIMLIITRKLKIKTPVLIYNTREISRIFTEGRNNYRVSKIQGWTFHGLTTQEICPRVALWIILAKCYHQLRRITVVETIGIPHQSILCKTRCTASEVRTTDSFRKIGKRQSGRVCLAVVILGRYSQVSKHTAMTEHRHNFSN